jgi:putative component of membrane protein insertase Oxa1/YidC/SpoIIIJ protein YidD/tetratricopeptide (TPR) repeat protein
MIRAIIIVSIVLFWWKEGACQSIIDSSNVDIASISIDKRHPKDNRVSSASDYIGVYQKYVSGIRGHECPMYPSCSNFGLKAFNKRNFMSACVLTSDRLMRCGHDHSNYPLTLSKKGFKYLDFPANDSVPSDLYYHGSSYYFAFSDTARDDSVMLFIKSMINDHYYREALLEISRLEFYEDKFSVDLFINKFICLKALGEYEKALFEYETKCPGEFRSDVELLFQIADIQYKLQNFEQAGNANEQALKMCTDNFVTPKLLLMDGLIHARMTNWDKAINSYKQLESNKSYQQIGIANGRIATEARDFKRKSPLLAGVLSIIPGMGYGYTGHAQTAISAFLVNGLLGYATYSSFKTGNVGMGILTAVFNLSFYIGNIYGSAKSAHRYNEQFMRNYFDKLEFNSHL